MASNTTSKGWIVITSIHPPTDAVRAIAERCGKGWSAVMVGDLKTPSNWKQDGIHFLSVSEQKERWGALADLIPYNHYCRKNLGYLYAIAQGAEFILETDDDNIAYPKFGQDISATVSGRQVNRQGWANVYKAFTRENIWPRGLPLDEIQSSLITEEQSSPMRCAIQQFLADDDPDVDAIYRLAIAKPVMFDPLAAPLILNRGSWAPFNSQNTLFFAEALPLLYLPCHVSFRMTDIWRSFVAQAALWTKGGRIAFKASTVKQIRNSHNLMKDFQEEVIGYQENRRIADLLEETLKTLVPDSLDIDAVALALWESLMKAGIIPEKELEILRQWLRQVNHYVGKQSS